MKKIVAHVITELNIGGAEKQLALLLPELQKSFDNHVICAVGTGKIAQQLSQQGISVHFLNSKSQYDPFAVWRLYKTLKKIKPNTIITYLFFANIAGRIAAKLAGVKTVITSHRSSLVNREWLHIFDRTTKSLVTHHIVQTNYAKKHLAKILHEPESKFTVIPNAVKTGGLAPRSPVTAGRSGVLCVANLKPGKGHEYLLKAFSQLNANTELHLAGDGPLKQRLQEQAKQLGIAEQVKFLGTRRDIPKLLAETDIFVLPTEGEGMSNAILEAMAAGVPIVTSDIPANKEIIKHKETGLLFQNKNSQDLAKKLEQFITNPELQASLANNAQAKIRKDHAIHVIAKQWTQILNHKFQ